MCPDGPLLFRTRDLRDRVACCQRASLQHDQYRSEHPFGRALRPEQEEEAGYQKIKSTINFDSTKRRCEKLIYRNGSRSAQKSRNLHQDSTTAHRAPSREQPVEKTHPAATSQEIPVLFSGNSFHFETTPFEFSWTFVNQPLFGSGDKQIPCQCVMIWM
jgi:hypothetical protein